MPKISDKEYLQIKNRLYKLDNVFHEMWRVQPRMEFSDEYDTVVLEIVGQNFRLSCDKLVWKSMTIQDKLFAICHEYAHILLGHWINPGYSDEWLNLAQDIEVNEYLLGRGISCSKKMLNDGDIATVKTVFRHKSDLVRVGETSKYYLGLIKKCVVS